MLYSSPERTVSCIHLVGGGVFSWLQSATSPLGATKFDTLENLQFKNL